MKLKIEQERIKNEWTMTYISEQIGLTLSGVSKILSGHAKPGYATLCKLEDLFKLSHRDLFKSIED